MKKLPRCIAATGLIGGQTVHVDATLIRADVSWESLVVEHAERVLDENRDDGGAQDNKANDNSGKSSRRGPGRPRTRQHYAKKRTTTDPDCSLTTSSKEFRMTPSYKQHTAVDERAGVVLDAEVVSSSFRTFVFGVSPWTGVLGCGDGISGRGWRGAVDAILGAMDAFFTGLMRIRCFGIILSEKQTDFVCLEIY